MKKWIAIFVSIGLFSVAGAEVMSQLQKEFADREAIRLTPEQGDALNFMKALGYKVTQVIEIEILEEENGKFLTRDKENNVCFGSIRDEILRCKNKAGISTVLYEGDGD